MKIQVITSFNQYYYDIIGRECLSTWQAFWPEEITMVCYLEEMTLPQKSRIDIIEFSQLDPDYWNFQKEDFKDRVKTFAKKAYCVMHAMANSTADRIIWLDADVLSTKSIPLSLLHSVMPDDVVSTHMGVRYITTKSGQPGDWLVPETGWFALNTRHLEFAKFRDEYHRRYRARDFSNLRRGYDNDVYGAALTRCNTPSLDLCQGLKKHYKTPLRHTVLGDYLKHYKAKHSKLIYVNGCDDQ